MTVAGTGTASAEPQWDGYVSNLPASTWLYAEQVASRYRDRSLDPRDCTAYTYLGVTGTSDTNETRDPDNPAGRYVGAFGVELESEDVRSVWVPYPARAVFTSYSTSVETGRATTHELMRVISETCPDTRFLLAGYSQGADAVAGVLEDIAAGEGPVSEDRISRAVLVANPRRSNSGVEYHGTADPESRGMLAAVDSDFGGMTDRIAEICNDGDVWCSASPVHRVLGPVVTEASVNLRDAVAVAAVIEEFFGEDVIRAETFRDDIESILRFALGGSAPHVDYENVSADGGHSMAEWALDYLRAGIR